MSLTLDVLWEGGRLGRGGKDEDATSERNETETDFRLPSFFPRSYADILESEMTRELENGRLVRLLCKFGFINERPEYVHLSFSLLDPPSFRHLSSSLTPLPFLFRLALLSDSTTTPAGPNPEIDTSSNSSETWSSIRSTR